MTDELKPVRCGCGGEAEVLKFNNGSWLVMCNKCRTSSENYTSKDKAITAWNRAMGAKTAKVEGNRCIACDNYIRPCMKYCDHCGAKLDWSDDE